jgi:hypothetical protein
MSEMSEIENNSCGRLAAGVIAESDLAAADLIAKLRCCHAFSLAPSAAVLALFHDIQFVLVLVVFVAAGIIFRLVFLARWNERRRLDFSAGSLLNRLRALG